MKFIIERAGGPNRGKKIGSWRREHVHLPPTGQRANEKPEPRSTKGEPRKSLAEFQTGGGGGSQGAEPTTCHEKKREVRDRGSRFLTKRKENYQRGFNKTRKRKDHGQ